MKQDIPQQSVAISDLVATFPLSATQLRCWFLDQMQPGNPALNVAVRWELNGQLSATTLEQAFQHVIDRHEILRTRFRLVDGTPQQQVVQNVAFRLDSLDLRAITKADQPARIKEIAHEIAERPFDLGQAGLIRASFVRLSADNALIIFVVHQTCFDGYSIGILGHEIGTVAQAIEAGTTPDLPELELQYGDFTLWQEEYLASGVLEEESAYWLKTLQDAPYFEVTPDKPRPRIKTTNVDAAAMDLPADFGTNLERVSKRLGVSPFTFGTAIFTACLGALTGAKDILFGTQIAGRMDTDLDPLIGVFINNIVLRSKVDMQARIADHVVATKPVVEGALSHQTMPFNILVERLNPPRDPSRTPLISVNFTLQNVFMQSKSYGAFDLRSSPSHAPGAIYDLDFAVMGRPTGWQLNLEYAASLFDAQTVQDILTLVSDAFALAFADPDACLSDIPVSAYLTARGDAERQSIIRAEQALMDHNMVLDAAVVQTGDGFYGFVIPGDTSTLPLEKLPQRIMESLDADSGIIGVSLLGAFPRTATGEINKTRLVVPNLEDRAASSQQVRPDVIAALKADWEEILGIVQVAPDAHFFDLGGHSVLVLRQLARIRERWAVALDVTAMYENAQLSDLARVVSARLNATAVVPESDWRFMKLATKGDGQPLIAVNNAATGLALATAGNVTRQVSCARITDGNRGFLPAGQSFPEIAAAYADVIQEGQPEGPYLLYGNCVHGNLALEVARNLAGRGAEIAGVVMKDVWEPVYSEAIVTNPQTRGREKRHALRNRLAAVRNGEMSPGTMLRFYSIARRSGVVALGTMLGIFKRNHSSDLDDEQEAFISFLSKKRDTYCPEAIDFPVLHIVTKSTPQGHGFLPSIGWEKVIAKDCLKTVHLDKVLVLRDKRIGVDAMAQAIEVFLNDRQPNR